MSTIGIAPDPLETRYPRRWVPPDADLGDWPQVERLFDRLDARTIGGAAELEGWLLEWSELGACLGEEESRRYIAMTCQTDDPERERAYLRFIDEISPRAKTRWHQLRLSYLRSPHRPALPPDRYFVFDRAVKQDVELFRDENVPLETEEEKLSTEYQKITGGMTVEFDGREQTLQQMARYLEEPDRMLRQEAWVRMVERRLRDRDRLGALYDQMISLRQRMARNADLADYRLFRFRQLGRFDYTPEDCLAFHAAVEQRVVPAARRLHEHRRSVMRLDRLRPWDLGVDPRGRAALRPFGSTGELVHGCQAIFDRLDPALGSIFRSMAGRGLLDLESRKGKAPGGYQTSLEEVREPFIFMNAVGLDRDLTTLLHEGGHAFHAVAARHEPLVQYRHAPIEFCEVASMGMELLANPHLDVFYRGEDLARRRRTHLEQVIVLLGWIAQVDAFQHWVYTHPGHDHAERNAAWLDLDERFGTGVDWSGFEEARAWSWQRQLHLFTVPFYYIEYGIAQLGALGVWRNSKRDPRGALELYRGALALGGSRPLPELFAAAGVPFDFSPSALAPLVDLVEQELAGLPE